ncbi:MAG: hypothetical protein JRI45_11625, partial [Deltaproteobacteria bacterium]|nr:hypothetical protein [Deltaproteobacteria bacterium]
ENIQDEIEILTNPKLLYIVIPELEKKLKELEQLRGDHRGLLGLVESALTKLKKLPQRVLIFLGLKRKPNSTEELFRAFRNALVVKWQEESNVIRVAFRWDDPRFAAYAANKYVDAYMRYRSRINKPQLSVEFYESQIGISRKIRPCGNRAAKKYFIRGTFRASNKVEKSFCKIV